MRYIIVPILVTALLVLSSISITWACFDPSGMYSGEVLFNKPGVSYNFTLLETIMGIVKVNDNIYIYRSHVGNAVVILYIEKCIDGVPAIDDHNGTIEYYPGVRVELLNISADYAHQHKENITTWLKNIFSYELNWLVTIGIIKGIDQDDIDSIISTIEAGFAGWNSRLIYYTGDNQWHPYDELVGNELIYGELLRSLGCRWTIPASLLPDQPPEYTISHITNNSPSSESGSLGEKLGAYSDGFYVLIAVITGLLVALTLAFALKR